MGVGAMLGQTVDPFIDGLQSADGVPAVEWDGRETPRVL